MDHENQAPGWLSDFNHICQIGLNPFQACQHVVCIVRLRRWAMRGLIRR